MRHLAASAVFALAAACGAPAAPAEMAAPAAPDDGETRWPALRAWLSRQPSDAISYRAFRHCDADDPPPTVAPARELAARVIASRDRAASLGDEAPIARACPDTVSAPGIASCVWISGFFADWTLSIDQRSQLVGIDEDQHAARCTLDVAALEAMVATPATLDVDHRSIWDPNDDPDSAEPERQPRLTTGSDAARVVLRALTDLRRIDACIGDADRCVSGCGPDTTCTELSLRADGSVALLLHYDAGAPTATTDELTTWSHAQRARFAVMMTLPLDLTQLPEHE